MILTDRADRRRKWADSLESTRLCVWSGPDEMPQDATPEVVITDSAVLLAAPAALRGQLTDGRIGVIAMGTETPADVSLPAGAPGRELRLAALLLSEIVRLRRRCHAESRARKVLGHLATSDPLTGLPNRRAWEEQVAARVQVASSGEECLCLALLDLDHFKRINDQFGHVRGDKVLRAVGEALEQNVRQGDFVARLGGDEFGLLLGEVDRASAPGVVGRMRQAVAGHLSRAELPVVTASVGYGLTDADDTVDADALFRAVDDALRRAKETGRDRSCQSGS